MRNQTCLTRHGYTLAEILVVLTILVILVTSVAIVVPEFFMDTKKPQQDNPTNAIVRFKGTNLQLVGLKSEEFGNYVSEYEN